MTTIKNANSKELKIIKKYLKKSGLVNKINKVVVINDFVDKYCEKHYPNFIFHGDDEDKKLYGMHVFHYETQKSDIIISSISFISKNPDKRYSFDSMLIHELGHANYAQHHLQEYDEFLKKILPKSKMLKSIALEVIADIFKNKLKDNKQINQKEILREAKSKVRELVDEFNETVEEGCVPDYIYTLNGFSIIPEE